MRSNNGSPVTKCRSGGSLIRPIGQKDKFSNISILNSNNTETNQTTTTTINHNVKLVGMKLRDEFICPITLELLKDPVCASDGYTYERLALEKWLKSNELSPLTGQIMEKNFISNMNLKKMIRDLIAEGGVGLYSYDSSLKKRVIEICPQKVLILKCLGPSENEWHGRSQEITHSGCIGGRKIVHTFREGRPTDVMHFTDTTVSRRHFEVTYDQSAYKYRIKDLGSAGGTYIRIPFGQRKQLHKGMMLAFGKHEFSVSTLIDEITGDDENSSNNNSINKKNGNIQSSTTRNRSQSASSVSVYNSMQYDVTDDTPMKVNQPTGAAASDMRASRHINNNSSNHSNNSNSNRYHNNNNHNNNSNIDDNNHNYNDNNNMNANLNINNNMHGSTGSNDNIAIIDNLDQSTLSHDDRLVAELVQMRQDWSRRISRNNLPNEPQAVHNNSNMNNNSSNNNNNEDDDDDGDRETIISLDRGCSHAVDDDDDDDDDCEKAASKEHDDDDDEVDKTFITQIRSIAVDNNHNNNSINDDDDDDDDDVMNAAVCNSVASTTSRPLNNNNINNTSKNKKSLSAIPTTSATSTSATANANANAKKVDKEVEEVEEVKTVVRTINVRCSLFCFSPVESPFYGKTFEIDRHGAMIGRKLSCDVAICPKPPSPLYNNSNVANSNNNNNNIVNCSNNNGCHHQNNNNNNHGIIGGGGGEKCSLLPIDTAVSGEHAKIDFDPITGLFYVSDGNGCRPSTNGTWQRLSSAFAESPHYPIECGTEILVGSVRFQAQSTLTIVEKASCLTD